MTNTQKVLKKYGVGEEKKSMGKDKTLPMHAAVVSKVEEMTQRQGGESQTRSILEKYGIEPSAKGTSIATQKKTDPFVRDIIDTQPYIAGDSALFNAVARVRSGKSVEPTLEEVYAAALPIYRRDTYIPAEAYAAAAQRVETPKPESRYQRGGSTYRAEDDPFIRAIINTQNRQDGKRTSAAVEYDLDTLNKRYDALWQEAEAWENQAVFQGTPEEMWEWERKAEAKRREAEALLPKIDALQQELDTVKAAEKKEMMEQGGYREADLKDIIINSFKRGYLGAEQGKESYKEMMGEGSTRRAEYEELLAGEDYKFVPMHWWEEAISGASSQLGQQLSQAADPSTLALMGGFGGMAAAAGQAGPQVLVPEEVVTVPAALAAGFTAGSAMNNIKIEAGNSYNELLEHGVSENTARAIAGAIGGINGALESLQLDSLLNSFSILKSTGASKTALSLIVEELKRRGLDIANNVTQEVLQEGATIAGTQLGSKMETGKWAYGAGEVADRLKDTAISSALTFSALNVPGTIRSVGSNLSGGRTVGNTGQGIAAGKEAAFEALDTDTGLGYDAFISTRAEGMADGSLDVSRDEGTVDPQRAPLIQAMQGQEKPAPAEETIRTSLKLKRPKLSKQEWRQVQSAQMQKYAGIDEESIPETGHVFAHDKFYWIRNYGLGTFEVLVRLNPATQQAKINRILEGINNGYDGQFGETSWETNGEH